MLVINQITKLNGGKAGQGLQKSGNVTLTCIKVGATKLYLSHPISYWNMNFSSISMSYIK